MTQKQFLESLKKTYDKNLEISRKKNSDYTGSVNPFKNFEGSEFVGVSVERGILVRIMDKISRVSALLDNEAQVKDESIYDTLADLCNYSAILKAYLENKYGKTNL